MKKQNVVKGNHLTVTNNKDGSVSLVWDWDALVKEVQEAINNYKPENVIKDIITETEIKVKKTRSKPKMQDVVVEKTTKKKKK